MLTESDKTTINLLAKKWDVKPDIHLDDFIFQFVYNHPGFSSRDKAIQYYFDDGQTSAQNLSRLLLDVCRYDPQNKIKLLEFASGYGCVTRHLGNVLPFVDVISCDIHMEAVSFIRDRLQEDAVASRSIPEELDPGGKFDVVFALSFFSHMPKTTFTRWLRKLASLVKPNGHLIFTTHGIQSAKILPNVRFDREGFWFQPSSEQKDLDSAEYGLTCTRPEFVLNQVFGDRRNRLVYYHEAFWWKHQDVFVIRRDQDNFVENPNVQRNQVKKLWKSLAKRILPKK